MEALRRWRPKLEEDEVDAPTELLLDHLWGAAGEEAGGADRAEASADRDGHAAVRDDDGWLKE